MLAVVTNYYNPSNNSIKLKNYQSFRDGMGDLPVFVIEAAFEDQPFTLEDSIKVRCQSVLWQQYRLVNHIISNLPDDYDKAVWVDADILFDDPHWYEKMDEKLDSHKMVQSFSDATLLSKNCDRGEHKRSVTKVAMENSKLPHNTTSSSYLDLSPTNATGFSWGVQREVVEKYGIYNHWITGSDDIAFVIAIWGDWNNSFFDRMNDKMREHYMDWAIPFHHYINMNVSCLEGHIRHLWHGHRNYKKRWKCLKDFNPFCDVTLSDSGCLEWSSDKPDLHECCRNMCLHYDKDFKIIT